MPGRWIDWSAYHPEPSWSAIAWRHHDDRLRTGARTAWDRLLHPGHTETYDRQPLDWRSWTTYTALIGDPHLSNAALGGQTRGIGHTTRHPAPVIDTAPPRRSKVTSGLAALACAACCGRAHRRRRGDPGQAAVL